MRYVIAAAAFALVAGITLGFVLSRGLDGSASAAPKAQAVEEQNVDASGFIAVHEQGVADVNVVDSGPVEYRTLIGKLQNTSSTGWCDFQTSACDFDLDASLTALATDGWKVVHVVGGGGSTTPVIFTLARPAP